MLPSGTSFTSQLAVTLWFVVYYYNEVIFKLNTCVDWENYTSFMHESHTLLWVGRYTSQSPSVKALMIVSIMMFKIFCMTFSNFYYV